MDSIIDKVKKLIALSNNNNSIHEANAAAAMANKLIDTYRISQADLEIEGSTAEAIIEDDDFIYTSGRITQWKSTLAVLLAKHYGCAVFNDNTFETGRKVSRYRLVGRHSDIGIAKYMFTWLTAECNRLAAFLVGGQGKIPMQSFCIGFVAGIRTQLKASREEVSGNSAAMVLINQRQIDAEKAMHSLHALGKGATHSGTRTDAGSFHLGKSKGESIHLGGKLAAGTTKMLG